jgi:hypothetical protein
MNTPSLGASAAVSALVASAVQPTVGPATAAAYNFVSTVGTSSIQELWVSVNNASGTYYTSTSTAPVTQITVSGPGANGTTSTATAPVVYTTTGGVAHVTGLNIQVPVGNAGQDIAITPTYNFVGTNGLTTGVGVKLGLIENKFQAGQTVTDSGLIGIGGSTTYANDGSFPTSVTPIYSNPMVVVASYPVVANSNGIVGVSSGATMGAGMQVLQFTITANSSGPVRVKQIAVTPNWAGTLTNAATDSVKIYNVSNPSTILNGSGSGQPLALVTGTQVGITFTTPEVVAAGTSKTYTVTVDTTGLTSTGNSFRLDLTNTNEALIAPANIATIGAAKWAWNDSTVGSQGLSGETFLNGYLVQNLPVTGPTFTR